MNGKNTNAHTAFLYKIVFESGFESVTGIFLLDTVARAFEGGDQRGVVLYFQENRGDNYVQKVKNRVL